MKTRCVSARLTAVAALMLSAGSALAAPTFTTVNAPPGGELGHTAILQNIYGGAWAVTGPTLLDRESSSMLATRVADAGVASPLSLAGGSASSGDDAAFAGQTVVVTARATYAGDRHTLGWIDDTRPSPAFQPIIDSRTTGVPVTLTLSASFRWALRDDSTGFTFTSRPGDNAGVGVYSSQRFDQLVTYHITGKNEVHNEWALFWEDRIAGQNADNDYNDAAFTVNVIPGPGSAGLAALGAGILGRRRRR